MSGSEPPRIASRPGVAGAGKQRTQFVPHGRGASTCLLDGVVGAGICGSAGRGECGRGRGGSPQDRLTGCSLWMGLWCLHAGGSILARGPAGQGHGA
jgi:hypothetical protein